MLHCSDLPIDLLIDMVRLFPTSGLRCRIDSNCSPVLSLDLITSIVSVLLSPTTHEPIFASRGLLISRHISSLNSCHVIDPTNLTFPLRRLLSAQAAGHNIPHLHFFFTPKPNIYLLMLERSEASRVCIYNASNVSTRIAVFSVGLSQSIGAKSIQYIESRSLSTDTDRVAQSVSSCQKPIATRGAQQSIS